MEYAKDIPAIMWFFCLAFPERAQLFAQGLCLVNELMYFLLAINQSHQNTLVAGPEGYAMEAVSQTTWLHARE